jgi:hypothetical protein
MTEEEKLRSEVRELKMRLRELRTENAELKLQQKRWLTLSTGVSVFSLILAIVMFSVTGDIKVQLDSSSSSDLDIYTNLEPEPIGSGESEITDPLQSELEMKPVKKDPIEEDSTSFLDAPDLGLEINPPKPDPKPPVRNTEPSRGGAFELPGSNQGPKKRVIQYTVKKNDTLWHIAKKTMGSSKSSNIRKIMKDNGLTDSRLEPGMSLVIIVEE